MNKCCSLFPPFFEKKILEGLDYIFRFDTNLIKNADKNETNTFNIELVQEGYTVVRAIGGQSLMDFLIFQTETGISPAPSQVGVGDILILESLVEGLHGQLGKWTSEPSGIVHIDSEEGTALALKTGNARISYRFGSDLLVTLNVEVVKSTRISFLPRDRHLTNEKNVIQAVELKLISDQILTGESNQNNVLGLETDVKKAKSVLATKNMFSCQAKFVDEKNDMANVFLVESGFHGGNYACLFTALDDSLQFKDDVEITVIPG